MMFVLRCGLHLKLSIDERLLKPEYALPQSNFEYEAFTAIPNGSFNPFDWNSTSEQD